MGEYSQSRLESRIVEAVNTLIATQAVKNPNLGRFVSITGIELSKDNGFAKLFVSCLSDSDKTLDRSVAALQSASGFIQARLAKILKTRKTPVLTFVSDRSLSDAIRINALIDSLKTDETDQKDN
ncbi:MAG: 30S ribosome-binding factor RbfA [Sphaerochaetaceae bacterium]|jgi:ribosome-binding factor A|nr:30S ribosome-binding factor RbfA [Sphaerochaetaceae bacterium]